MSKQRSQRPVQFVTPMPPSRSGIAQYSADLLQGLDGHWPLNVIEDGKMSGKRRRMAWARATGQVVPDSPTILQLGNSENHELGMELAKQGDQMIVLHDVVLHHAMLSIAVNRRKTKMYRQLMRDTYGQKGDRVATSILTGRSESLMMDYPLSEQFIQDSRLTVVHNHVAESMVRELVPSARLTRVPMGVPLPYLTPQTEARRALQLEESAFIVASITHVNPMKRLDKVIRAFASVVKSQPDAKLIIAGSVGAGVDLPRMVRLHNLEQYIDIWGYIDDSAARLLARAADVCVNLRHPTAGETSASLLRLLGAAKPVLVTDNVPETDLPSGVGLRVAVDKFEVEMLAELLIALARDPDFSESAGRAARDFVEKHHTMQHMIAGYRAVISQAFDVEMPPVDEIPNLYEPSPAIPIGKALPKNPQEQSSALEDRIADSLNSLGMTDAIELERIGNAMTSIGLDNALRPSVRIIGQNETLVAKIRCPACGSTVLSVTGNLECASCHASLGTTSAPDLRPNAQPE